MNTHRLSLGTLTLIVSNVGGAGLSFLLAALIGRAWGEEGLGIYAVAMAWVFPLSMAVEFGLGTLMTRDLAADALQTTAMLRAAVLARLWLGGTALLLLLTSAPLLSDDARIVAGLHISAPLVIILPFYSAFTAVFRARGAMWPIPWLNIGMLAAQVGLTVLAFASGGGVLAALVVNVVTSAGQLAAAWVVYRWKFCLSVPASPRIDLLPLLRRAWPFGLAALFAALQTRLGIILLEALANTAEVGYFAAANRFIEAARMFPNAFFGAVFPMLSALAAEPHRLEHTFSRALIALGAFGTAVAVGLALLAVPLLTLVYGDGFAHAAPALVLLGLSLLFSLLRGGRTLYWYALGKERYVNVVNGSVIALQLAASAWLIPPYGAAGAALAVALVEAAALALLWREIRFAKHAEMAYEQA